MKKIFSVIGLSLASVFVCSLQAQHASPVYEIDTTIFDPGTKEAIFITKKLVAGDNGSGDTLTLYFQKRRSGEIDLVYTHYLCLFSDMDLGCSGTGDNYVRIKLENGETIKLVKDISEVNCKPPAESIYLLDYKIIEKLKVNKIVSIRLKQSKYYTDFSIWYTDLFRQTAYLLAKYI